MGTKKLAILFLFSVILAFAAGYFSSNLVENRMVIESDEMFRYITRAFDEYYYYELDNDDTYDAFIESMYAVVDAYAKANNDPYTMITSYQDNLGSNDLESYVGLGIDYRFVDYNILVTDVNPTSDLYMRVFPNDLIIGLVEAQENLYFNDLESLDDVISLFDGRLGDTITLIVENPLGDVYPVTFEYKEVLTPSAYDVDLGLDDVAYIKIGSFIGYEEGVTPGTNYVFNQVLNELEATVLDGEDKTLILDLRDNLGGSLSAISSEGSNLTPGIAQLLLKNDIENPLYNLVDRDEVMTSYYGGLSEEKTYDIKVLVNENTASESEILAASLMMNGYQLYGEETFGKSNYQNAIYLNDIRNIRFYLTYTEGIWTYDGDRSVDTDPLSVTHIEQNGMYTVEEPLFNGVLSYDMIDQNLVNYQMFLNAYFNLDQGTRMRTDGYFDLDTENWIKQYQIENQLDDNGTIDLETARMIYLDYEAMTNDISFDVQLQTLISLIGTDNA